MRAAFSSCASAVCDPLHMLCDRSPNVYSPVEQAIDYTGALVAPLETSTRKQLGRLREVKNARDLAEACSLIQHGMVFRSACPTAASAADTALLREELAISELIDLRSSEERKEDAKSLLLEASETIEFEGHSDLLHVEAYQSRRGAPARGDSVHLLRAGTDSEAIEAVMRPASHVVHHVALMEKERYIRALLKRLPWCTAATALLWSMLNRSYAMSVVLGEVNKGGLEQLYEILLDSSAAQILIVLQLVLRASEAGRPVLFFCKIGKDRTGLIGALILAVCGASDIEIISDYARSQGADGVALGGLEKVKELKGLDHKLFSSAPPSAMATVLDHLRLVHGSPAHYLEDIGFDASCQERLRQSLKRRGV